MRIYDLMTFNPQENLRPMPIAEPEEDMVVDLPDVVKVELVNMLHGKEVITRCAVNVTVVICDDRKTVQLYYRKDYEGDRLL